MIWPRLTVWPAGHGEAAHVAIAGRKAVAVVDGHHAAVAVDHSRPW